MARILRRWLTAVLMSASVVVAAPPPASAAPFAGTFWGTASLGCFGCGVGTDGTFSGTFVGTGGVLVPMAATFAYQESPETCALEGTAAGRAVIGAVPFDFEWTRVLTHAVITYTSASSAGHGEAIFIVTSPIGNACGQPVTALVVGHLAGL